MDRKSEREFKFWDPFNAVTVYSAGKPLSVFFEQFEKAFNGGNDPILMDFTGRKDKNGKKIYERDIVKAPRNDSRSMVRLGPYRCQWGRDEEDFHFGFYTEDALGYTEGLHANGNFYEVLGNIYENGGLLK